MPGRKTPLINGQHYHVFNKSINHEPIFTTFKDCRRALMVMDYYHFKKPPIKLSHILKLNKEIKDSLMKSWKKETEKLVEIICFCLIPNHFHFILKQISNNGISIFLSLFQNSYSRYFNTRHERHGHIFQGQFKAARIETEEYLLHLSRYIHLNPYSSFLIKDLSGLKDYPWSSLSEYLEGFDGICNKNLILSQFSKGNNYKNFVYNQADYQRNLEVIKHLIFK